MEKTIPEDIANPVDNTPKRPILIMKNMQIWQENLDQINKD